jgi:hypothetical protein
VKKQRCFFLDVNANKNQTKKTKLQNHPPQKPSLPPPSPPPPPKPSPPSHHAHAQRSCGASFVSGNLLDVERRWRSHSAEAPPQRLPGAPFTKGPFPLLNARSAKPTVLNLSFSLSKSPKGTLRHRVAN